MDRQYVVDFMCTTAPHQDPALDRVMRAEEDWISWMLGAGTELRGVFTRDAEWRRETLHNGMNHTIVLSGAATGQPVDGRYMHVGAEEELQVVMSVQVDRRLPIILVGMSGDSDEFASQLAQHCQRRNHPWWRINSSNARRRHLGSTWARSRTGR